MGPKISNASTSGTCPFSGALSNKSQISRIQLTYQQAASTFLCRLVPQQQPRADEVASYITRANLDPNTVALAACILDSLSSSFVRSWRKACEKARSPEIPTFRSDPMKPELIVLGGLAVAHAYLHDVSGEPKWWGKITNNTMEPRDINATTNCILQDIDYGLMSFTMEDLEDKMQEMFGKGGGGFRSGKAVVREGQLTPEESPP